VTLKADTEGVARLAKSNPQERQMKKLLCGVALLPFLAATAFAQPSVLNEKQMDTVTAGWDLQEIDVSNTSVTWVDVYHPLPSTSCSSCYLDIQNDAISVRSLILGGLD
jgi:hypothetical protein